MISLFLMNIFVLLFSKVLRSLMEILSSFVNPKEDYAVFPWYIGRNILPYYRKLTLLI